MTQEDKKIILQYIEKVLDTHDDVIVNYEKSMPKTKWDNGFPEFIETRIMQTITITSNFLFTPQK